MQVSSGDEEEQLHQEVSLPPRSQMAPGTTATKRRRRLSSSIGNPPLPTLPFDLVLEILYRLPVKSLMQFKCVCKSWKSFISHPKFAKKHFCVSTKTHHLFFHCKPKGSFEYIIKAFPLSTIFTKKVTPTATTTQQLDYPLSNPNCLNCDRIRGSCHGILCIVLYTGYVILWNPSIRKFTKLPSLEILWNNVVAFSSTYHNGVSDVQTHVHTSGTNFWRRIQNCPRNLYKESGKFVGGTLYLLPYDHLSIVSLDLEKESYQELFLPDYRSTYVFRKSLCVLKDCLCILSSHIGCSSEVWLMKEYINSESWTKLFHVPPLIEGVGSVIYERALYVYENDLVLLVVYNSRDGTFKSLKIKKQHGGSKWMIPEVFQESLIYVMLCNMGFRHIKNSSELQL
ncbi:F-box protein interaction domain protein [Medicago truncatula]|uniref:F-box protein interaction domain protein n=1 Tax=Medicago truncatula TaxID=3880 RepID=G7KRC3_MEDTR|nr:F-box protein interaction domain protein [Medicago truncatula]